MSRGRYFTFAEAAERYPFTEKALRHMADRRVVPCHRIRGRVYLAEADLEALFDAGRVEPPSTRRRPDRSRGVA